MEINTKYKVDNEVYLISLYYNLADDAMWKVSNYGKKCTITDIIVKSNAKDTYVYYLLWSKYTNLNNKYVEENLFLSLDEAEEECERRNNEAWYG